MDLIIQDVALFEEESRQMCSLNYECVNSEHQKENFRNLAQFMRTQIYVNIIIYN
jgi:hypothetical protein